MTTSEIIEGVLKDLRTQAKKSGTSFGDEVDYETEIISVLEASLKGVEKGTNIRTCEDFRHLNVRCCETCHTFDQHYEMSLIDIESGGDAWICCAMDRALNPRKRARLEQSPEYEQIRSMLGSDIRGTCPS
jgi:hypothetical protein